MQVPNVQSLEAETPSEEVINQNMFLKAHKAKLSVKKGQSHLPCLLDLMAMPKRPLVK